MDTIYKITDQPKALASDLENHFSGTRFFLITDNKVARFCLPIIKSSLPPNTPVLILKNGEENKNLESCQRVWQFLLKHKADRHSVLLLLGGGMIGDLGGFCASVFKRGIDFIHIPTTLLSMADASLGGKTGIDFMNGKNQLGTFKSPLMNWVYPGFLKTLPELEMRSGFAEIMKHFLLADFQAWNLLRKRDFESQNWFELVKISRQLKLEIVTIDPFEKKERKKLNAGHTVGHAIESLFLEQKQPIPHGLAIAAGLLIESFVSFIKQRLSETELTHIEEFIFSVFGKLPLENRHKKSVWRLMLNDKKNRNDSVLAALIGPIGFCQIDQLISYSEFEKGWRYYVGK